MFHTERGKEETASKGKGEKRRKLTLYKVKLSVHYNHVEVIRTKQMETKKRTEEGKEASFPHWRKKLEPGRRSRSTMLIRRKGNGAEIKTKEGQEEKWKWKGR